MKVRYFTPPELVTLLVRDELPVELTTQNCVGVCSIADLISLTERQKKIEMRLTMPNLEARIKEVFAGDSAYYSTINIAELEASNLAKSLFSDENERFWEEAACSSISPITSIRRLTLRPSEQTWWDGELYEEMEQLMVDYRD